MPEDPEKGRYMTLIEYSEKSGIPVRSLHSFVDAGMPKTEQGRNFFVWEKEADEWIAANVEVGSVYRIKRS